VRVFAERLRDKGLKVGIYTGDTPPAVRTSLEDQFQNNELDVMVGTLDAMREGITLHGRVHLPLPHARLGAWLERAG
jgi:superfamily II DNA/RNA helicase